mmetsp:Transcript_21686/g.32288  ORF Transcript_21686/g.32288 Transcript_21686/m.32288 type:complete len:226 (+) Transcript_21686:1-678(+)
MSPIFFLCATAIAAQQSTFSFQDYLNGEWNVERFTVTVSSSEMILVSSDKYSFTSDGETGNLSGFFSSRDSTITEDSEESDEDIMPTKTPVLVEFEASNTGLFKTGDDEDTLFSFYFQNFNGPWMSHGEWNGQNPGVYQFNVVAHDKFTITVYPNDSATNKDAEVIILSATRVKSAKDKSFFEKYGSTIMMVGGFLLFQRLKGDGGRQAAAGAGGGAPTVEEKTN